MSENGYRLIGHGVYTIPEAFRLTRVPVSTVRRWLLGYRFRVGDAVHESPAIHAPDYPMFDGAVALSFLDLQEVRFVHAFRSHGVGWPTIRETHARAQAMLGTRHPFATGRFLTDGRSILLEGLDPGPRHRHAALLNVVRSQLVFRRLVAPFLKELDFPNGHAATRWWPAAGRRRVFLDPLRSFGQPIVRDRSVPTAVLARSYAVEQSYERVARWYEVPPPAVRIAVEFEAQLAAA